jgi:hypothetical protein
VLGNLIVIALVSAASFCAGWVLRDAKGHAASRGARPLPGPPCSSSNGRCSYGSTTARARSAPSKAAESRLAAAALGVLDAVDAPRVGALVAIRARASEGSGEPVALDAVLCGDFPLAVPPAAGSQQGGHEHDRTQRAHCGKRSPPVTGAAPIADESVAAGHPQIYAT